MEATRADWTVDPETGRTNSSPEFHRLAQRVGEIIRSDMLNLVTGNHRAIGYLVMAQLAHVEGLRPPEAPTTRVLAERADRRTT